MKNLKVLTFLLALVPTITACQDTKHSIVAINTIGGAEGLVAVSSDQVLALLDSKQSFTLETWSPNCVHCTDLRPKLEKYAANNKKVIYTFNILETIQALDEEEYNATFHATHPDLFPEYKDTYIPRIQFIKEGKLTYEVTSSKFASYNPLKKILNNHFLSSKIFMVDSKESLEAFEVDNKNYVAFSYDLDDQKSLNLAASYIINQNIAKTKKPVVLINYTTYTGVFNEVCAEYNADFITFASLVKNGEVNKTIDYSSADGNELNNLLSSL